MFAFLAFTIVQEHGGRSLSSGMLLFVPYLFFKILSYCCVLNRNTRLFHVLLKILCIYIKHIHNIYFSSQWNKYNQILTVHCHCYCSLCSITIKIERNAAVVHHLYSFRNCSYNHCIVVCTTDILITSVELIFCWWVGLCTAGDTERFIHKNDVVSQIGCHNGVHWVVV